MEPEQPTLFPDGADSRRLVHLVRQQTKKAVEAQTPGRTGPLNWRAVPASESEKEWNELRDWVHELIERFEFLDHHVIPECWWQHNGHVEALVSLRDHEQTTFGPLSFPSASVEWFRALRDMSGLLRAWTTDLACAGGHRPAAPRGLTIDHQAWQQHVSLDTAHRRRTSGDPNDGIGGEGLSPKAGEEPTSDVIRCQPGTAPDT